MKQIDHKALQREILLSFWKLHILHHAKEEAIYGKWMLEELRDHGYEVSPGTLYPMLHRMEKLGWLKSKLSKPSNPNSRRLFYTTPLGEEVLKFSKNQIQEFKNEIKNQE